MEHLIYLVVKVLAAACLLRGVLRFLFGVKGKSLWRFLTPAKKAGETPALSKPVHYNNVVGKSQTVYLEEPPKEKTKAIEPVFSEDLEKEEAEEEPEAAAGDVEDNLYEPPLSEEDRFIPLDTGPDSEAVSTGMTYEQISEALDVVRGKKADGAAESDVARMLYEIQGSDLFNFLSAQAENEALVEKLIKENMDNAGVPLTENKGKRRKIEEFDMGRYV
ncbi:hypothetical protein FACS189411_11380 [Bacteroidia bacterium]|nr:hypothetical protein FACS189411_11380 [Bacteroidia bacterium]